MPATVDNAASLHDSVGGEGGSGSAVAASAVPSNRPAMDMNIDAESVGSEGGGDGGGGACACRKNIVAVTGASNISENNNHVTAAAVAAHAAVPA